MSRKTALLPFIFVTAAGSFWGSTAAAGAASGFCAYRMAGPSLGALSARPACTGMEIETQLTKEATTLCVNPRTKEVKSTFVPAKAPVPAKRAVRATKGKAAQPAVAAIPAVQAHLPAAGETGICRRGEKPMQVSDATPLCLRPNGGVLLSAPNGSCPRNQAQFKAEAVKTKLEAAKAEGKTVGIAQARATALADSADVFTSTLAKTSTFFATAVGATLGDDVKNNVTLGLIAPRAASNLLANGLEPHVLDEQIPALTQAVAFVFHTMRPTVAMATATTGGLRTYDDAKDTLLNWVRASDLFSDMPSPFPSMGTSYEDMINTRFNAIPQTQTDGTTPHPLFVATQTLLRILVWQLEHLFVSAEDVASQRTISLLSLAPANDSPSAMYNAFLALVSRYNMEL